MSYTVARYLRLSAEDQDMSQAGKTESDSIANQRNLLRDFISQKQEFEGADVLEFWDDGWRGKNFERPGVRKMLEQVKQGKIQCIVVKDFSRFGRDYLTVGNYISRVFPFLGVRFIAVNDGFDSNRPMDIDSLETSFKTLLYDLYSRDLSRKVRHAKEFRARQGDFLSPFAPYGYKKAAGNSKQLVIDPEAAGTVRRIFHLAAEGISVLEIARTLNREGVLTPMRYKRANGCSRTVWPSVQEDNFWMADTVYNILRDEQYTGKTIYGKHKRDEVGKNHVVKVERPDWIIVEGAHEGIIGQEEFERVQKKIRTYTRNRVSSFNKEENCLYKKVRCGTCGHLMQRARVKQPYYFCRIAHITETCHCPTEKILESDLMKVALTEIRTQALYAVEISHIWEEKCHMKRNDTDATWKSVANLKETCIGLDRYIRELYEKYACGEMDKKEYLAAKNMAVRKRDSAAARIQEMEASLQNIDREGRLKNQYVEHFQTHTEIEELTSEIARDVLKEIIIYPGKMIHIVWNYQEDLKQMLLDINADENTGGCK